MSKPTVSMKLLIDTERRSVLFAEASGNIAAVLSDMLSLPVGDFVSILRQQETAAGSLANLCKSIENINTNLIPPLPVPKAEIYCCRHCFYGFRYSDDPLAVCPACYGRMKRRLDYVAPPPKAPSCEGGAGGANAAVNYMITDDLVVMPLSTISMITLLNRFGVKDVGALEEKVVHLGVDEAVKLLNASLRSKKALTDVFLTPKGIKTEPKGKGKGVKRERYARYADVVDLM